jgi:hypothetical protein
MFLSQKFLSSAMPVLLGLGLVVSMPSAEANCPGGVCGGGGATGGTSITNNNNNNNSALATSSSNAASNANGGNATVEGNKIPNAPGIGIAPVATGNTSTVGGITTPFGGIVFGKTKDAVQSGTLFKRMAALQDQILEIYKCEGEYKNTAKSDREMLIQKLERQMHQMQITGMEEDRAWRNAMEDGVNRTFKITSKLNDALKDHSFDGLALRASNLTAEAYATLRDSRSPLWKAIDEKGVLAFVDFNMGNQEFFAINKNTGQYLGVTTVEGLFNSQERARLNAANTVRLTVVQGSEGRQTFTLRGQKIPAPR